MTQASTLKARTVTRPLFRRASLGMALALIGLISCGPPVQPELYDSDQTFTGTVTIFNKTNELHTLTIRTLTLGASIDCQVVSQNPAAFFPDELFSTELTYQIPLFSGEELAVDPSQWLNNWNTSRSYERCQVFLVQSPSLSDIIVFYGENALETRTYYHNVDLPPEIEAGQQTIVIEADYTQVEDPATLHTWRQITCPDTGDFEWEEPFEWEQCDELDAMTLLEAARVPQGTRYSWRSVNDGLPLHFERERFDEGMPIQTAGRCDMPGREKALVWEPPPYDTAGLKRFDLGLDGCHVMTLEDQRRWTVCGPTEAFAPLAQQSEGVRVWFSSETAYGTTNEQLTLYFEGHPVLEQLVLMRGTSPSSLYAFSWQHELRQGCAPRPTGTCGESALPVDLRIRQNFGSREAILMVPGDTVQTADGELYLVRASYRPILNRACPEAMQQNRGSIYESVTGLHIEAVLSRNHPQ